MSPITGSHAVAVPHFSVSIITRGAGRSVVLSAAYRHCAKMEFEREARAIDYTRKTGLLYEAFEIPADAPQWLSAMIADRPVSVASELFWNAVEAFEKRVDAQLAKDITIALPIELSAEQNIALVRDFVLSEITAKGMVADWVYHAAPGNPHVHLMTTLRPLTEDGFGAKKVAMLGADGHPDRNDVGKIVYELWAGGIDAFNALRDGWFACQNRHLALAGLDIRVDGRSFEKQGIDLVPTIHLGVGTKAIERKAADARQKIVLERIELQDERRTQNVRRIQVTPDLVLDLVTREKSVFDERDVAKVLHRYIDDANLFQSLMAVILRSPRVLKLERERTAYSTGLRAPARYTTREMIRLEAQMANRAIWLSQRSSHGVPETILQATVSRHVQLSDEQTTAIEHVAGGARIAAVIGRAGAGKTTMMKAAREAFEAAGYRVIGAALAGKAAEGLEREAGIASRTLSSWELRWNGGRDRIDDKTVFVLDEAGMVSSRQMAFFVEMITKAGAKLVLIGDPEQLQPIEAGAAFRAITDRIGYGELDTIYRQRPQWMRDASLDLARGNVASALGAYRSHGRIIGAKLKEDAVTRLIEDWERDYDPNKTSLILAHLRADVRGLNDRARARLVARGILEEGYVFETDEGKRRFAAGDQVVFLKNETSLGVKNGTLGKVVEAAVGRICVEIGAGDDRRQLVVEQRFYRHVDHGYATTIHKSQGATVDRVKVLASLSLDRHLTYVAMTRHREDLNLYFGRRSFAKAGGLEAILSRRNAKETTLDYEGGPFYRQALRFAQARGMELVHVARTLIAERLVWIVSQRARLIDLGHRLAALTATIALRKRANLKNPETATEVGPMVAGMTAFARSADGVVDDRLAADLGLKSQWQEILRRFTTVYSEPEAAFLRIGFEAMLKDASAARATLAKMAAEPEAFGALKGKTGLFAKGSDKADRDRALRSLPALAGSLGDYLRQYHAAERHAHAEVAIGRRKAAVEIPTLSAGARQMLDRIGDALDRKDLSSVIQLALADTMVKAELDGFAKAVGERFGGRTFLGNAAQDPDGETFRTMTAEMNSTQKAEIRSAWRAMRTAQQLEAAERTAFARNQVQSERQAKTARQSL